MGVEVWCNARDESESGVVHTRETTTFVAGCRSGGYSRGRRDNYTIRRHFNAFERSGTLISTGRYDSTSMCHAELGAIEEILEAAGDLPNGCVIRTNKNPCKRCAAILQIFHLVKGLVIEAPVQNQFAANNAGSYSVPEMVLDVIVEYLVAQGDVTAEQGKTYHGDIGRLVCRFDF